MINEFTEMVTSAILANSSQTVLNRRAERRNDRRLFRDSFAGAQ